MGPPPLEPWSKRPPFISRTTHGPPAAVKRAEFGGYRTFPIPPRLVAAYSVLSPALLQLQSADLVLEASQLLGHEIWLGNASWTILSWLDRVGVDLPHLLSVRSRRKGAQMWDANRARSMD